MQTETHNPLSPSYRAWFDRETERAEGSGNVKTAIYVLHMEGFAAYETADGLLSMRPEYAAETVAAIEDRDFYAEAPRIFPIVAGCVDMRDIERFLRH